jgi:Bifunctional DNA primase/polymerase, N-terminal
MGAVLDAARYYLQQDPPWAVVPLPSGRKFAPPDGWPELRLTEAELPQHFNGRENIAGICGRPSGGRSDVDLDSPEARLVAPRLLPPTSLVHGRASASFSHYWYIEAPEAPYAKFVDPLLNEDHDRKVLVEHRTSTPGAHYSVLPPSWHPSGEQYRWERSGVPTTIEGEAVLSAVRKVAAASLLVRYWPDEGTRQDTGLALAGGLLRAGWAEGDVRDFIAAVADAAGDEETAKRAQAAEYTRRRLDTDRTPGGGRR